MTSTFWKKEYEKKAEDGDPIVQSGRGHKYDAATLLKAIQRAIDLLQLERTYTVLDVGCANGLFGERMAPLCERFVGIEPVEALASLARQALANCANANVLTASGESLPLRSKTIDRVLISEVVQLNPPQIVREMLKEAARVLRTSGRMVILAVPNAKYRAAFESAYLKRLAEDDRLTDSEKRTIADRHTNAYWYTTEALAQMAANLGGKARVARLPECVPNSDHRFDLIVDF